MLHYRAHSSWRNLLLNLANQMQTLRLPCLDTQWQTKTLHQHFNTSWCSSTFVALELYTSLVTTSSCSLEALCHLFFSTNHKVFGCSITLTYTGKEEGPRGCFDKSSMVNMNEAATSEAKHTFIPLTMPSSTFNQTLSNMMNNATSSLQSTISFLLLTMLR